jgi:hypothetical protein
MADVPVTLNGVLYDLLGRTSQRVVFIGDASYTGLGVGGGPMPGGPPLGFWGGVAPPLPTHPIAPGGPPPGIWGGANEPFPTPPIYIPRPPVPFPEPPPEGNKPPPPGGGWGYSEEYGWGFFPMGQSAGPKTA